mgnify:CR=1 FL=1
MYDTSTIYKYILPISVSSDVSETPKNSQSTSVKSHLRTCRLAIYIYINVLQKEVTRLAD